MLSVAVCSLQSTTVCRVMKFYFTTSLDCQARTAGHSPVPLLSSLDWSSNTKCNKDPSVAPGLQSLTSGGKFWSPVQPSTTLIKVDFSLNLFFLSLRCFITDIFSSNIFCSIFYLQTCPGSILPVCLPKDISQIGLHKVQIIVLFCSGQNNIRPTKTREGKIKKSKDRNTFST